MLPFVDIDFFTKLHSHTFAVSEEPSSTFFRQAVDILSYSVNESEGKIIYIRLLKKYNNNNYYRMYLLVVT